MNPTSIKVGKKRETKHEESEDEDDHDNEDSSVSSDSDMSSLSDYSMGEQTFRSLQKPKYAKTKSFNACVSQAIESHNQTQQKIRRGGYCLLRKKTQDRIS